MTPTSLPGWKWLPGMLGTSGIRYDGQDERGRAFRHERRGFTDEWGNPADCMVLGPKDDQPDLDDPATGGAMLALLGDEAWRAVGMYRETVGIGFYSHVAVPFGYRTDYHRTLARACLAVAVSLGRWPGGCK